MEDNSMVKDSTYMVPRLVSGMQYSTHTILLQIYSAVGEFYTNHRYNKRGGTPLRVSNKGGTPFIEGSSIQEIGRALGYCSTWVFIVGYWSSILVHSRGFLCAI
jgi:hypothetical protein